MVEVGCRPGERRVGARDVRMQGYLNQVRHL